MKRTKVNAVLAMICLLFAVLVGSDLIVNAAEEEYVRTDDVITAMDEAGNVTEIPSQSGEVEEENEIATFSRSMPGQIVNFNTKGNAITEYTVYGQSDTGYTNGMYGADAVYLGTENGRVKFMLSGVIGLVDVSEVQVVNVSSAASVSCYTVSGGRLLHNISTDITTPGYASILDNGPAPSYLAEGAQYYSYDGHYFYTQEHFGEMVNDYNAGKRTSSVNPDSPYYNYYQYLPLRSKTNYTAAQLNNIIYAKANNANSKMNDTAQQFIDYQNKYGVNALLMIGIAANESAWGNSSIAVSKNNLFGLNAVDSSPGQSANTYDSVDKCIKTFAETYMSKQYLNPKNSVYCGAFLGNKASGMNVRYASDPYWGEKNANAAWMIDKNCGNTDSNTYTVGIKDTIGLEYTDLNVRADPSLSGAVLYTTKYYSNQAFILLDKGNAGFYKIQSNAALNTNRTGVSSGGEYDFDNMYAYVSSDYIKIVSQGSGEPTIPDTPVTPDTSSGNDSAGFVSVPDEVKNIVQYRAHVSNKGWLDMVSNGQVAGTQGRNLAMEAIEVSIQNVANLGIKYSAYVQDIGWMDFALDGATGGTVGKAKQMEAIRMELTGDKASDYDIYYRAHVAEVGWLDWAKNGELSGTQGYNYAMQAVQIVVLPKGSAAPGSILQPYKIKSVGIEYEAHVQDKGWMGSVANGAVAGTVGENKQLEALAVAVKSENLGVKYRSYVQGKGWQDYVPDGSITGTVGQNKRIEAIQLKLSGSEKNNYDIYYRVHVENYGWMGWAKNDERAGTLDYGLKIEAVQILITPKDNPELSNGDAAFKENTTGVAYSAHVQDIGWQQPVADGETAGTTGLNKQVEALKISLVKPLCSGEIQYSTHVQDIGWQDYVSDGNVAGTVGKNKQVEAICIRLSGELKEKYDVYYRVHSSDFGWLAWTKNGEKAGSEGYARQVEAVQIKLVKKGNPAPSTQGTSFYKK